MHNKGSAMKGNMDLQETLIDGELMYRGNFIEVRKDRVRLPDGAEASREYVVHPGAVAVLALLDNGNLVMERQYRYPAGREFLEIPAGKIDPAEDGLSTGQRELLEETGYVAREWTHLTTTWPCIGYADERIEYYLARGLTRQQQNLDHGEFLEVFEMPLTQGIDWIREGKINDSKTIIGLLWLEKHLKGWQV